MDKEIKLCKDVPGFEGHYAVTDGGRVWSHKRHIWLKTPCDNVGYPVVVLRKPGVKKTARVHRLVAVAFIENPENLPQVNHKSGVKTDNRASNLEWVTHEDNNKHARENGLSTGLSAVTPQQRADNGKKRRLLSNEQVRKVRDLASGGLSATRIANIVGLHQVTISKLLRGESYREIV